MTIRVICRNCDKIYIHRDDDLCPYCGTRNEVASRIEISVEIRISRELHNAVVAHEIETKRPFNDIVTEALERYITALNTK